MSKLEKQVRFLQAYAAVVTIIFGAVIVSGFVFQREKQRFGEIDVERINVVEPDGQVKIVIANRERKPGPGNIVTGKFYERTGLKNPGILFYNAKGDEAGGLQVGSAEQDGNSLAGAHMAFDKIGGDQVIGFSYNQMNASREVGFNVWDQPDVSIEEQKRNWDAARKLKPGPERDALMQQAAGAQRVFVGRLHDKTAAVTLFDANSRPRLRLLVGPAGDPRLEFLDAQGKVIRSLTPGTSSN